MQSSAPKTTPAKRPDSDVKHTESNEDNPIKPLQSPVAPEVYLKTFTSNPVAIAITRLSDGLILEANNACAALFELNRDESIARPTSLLNIWPEKELRARIVDELRADGQIRNREITLQKSSGQPFLALFSAELINVAGEDLVITALQDISKRKQNESARIEAEERFRLFMDMSPTHAWIKDAHGRYAYANSRVEERIGVRQKDLLGKTDADFFPQEVARQFRNNDLAVLASNTRKKILEELVEANGAHSFWLSSKFSFSNAAGEQFVGGISLDITDRVQIENELRESHESLEMALSSSGMGIWRMDLQDRTQHFDKQVCRCLGMDPDCSFVSSEEFFKLVHVDDRPLLTAALNRAVETSSPLEVEYRVVWPDGSIRYINARGKLVGDTDGKPRWVNGLAWDITERKQSEEMVRLSEEKFSRAFAGNPAALAMTRLEDSTFLEVNDSWMALNERHREEVIGRSATDLNIWTSEEDAAIFLQTLKDKGSVRGWEQEFRKKSGELFTAQFSSSVLTVKGEKVALTTLVDISERRRAEESVRRSESLLRAVIENSPNAIYVKSRDSRWLMANPAVLQIIGKTEAQALGRNDREIFDDPQTAQAILENDRRIVESGNPAELEEIIDTVDGRRSFLSIKAPWQDEKGNIIGIVGVSHDITDRKNDERALKESEERYRSLFNNMTEGFALHEIIADAEGIPYDYRFLDVNPAFERLTGLKRAELQGRCVTEVIPNIEPQRIDNYGQVALTGTPIHFEGYSEALDYWFHVFAYQTAPGQFAVIFSDITERKRAEVEKQTMTELFVQAQKMESVGRLAGGVAHDFNNMLGVILGHTELALDQVHISQPLFDDLKEIQKAAQRSADLTRQLLAFARKQTVVPKVLDLNETVSGMAKMLKRLIGEDIGMEWNPGEGLWTIRMDPSQVDQIMANLAVNARDAIQGIGTLTIETANVTVTEQYGAGHDNWVSGDYVCLSIRDTGVGMDEQTLQHIFEPFFTTKDATKGTGLGLSTVYGIVKQNSGYIKVQSKQGAGTKFEIYLPRFQGSTAGTSDRSLSAAKGQGTVLLVEDEGSILRLTTRMLEDLGYLVLPAATPDEAIRSAQTHPGDIDVLLSDVVMPKMNGHDLANKIWSLRPGLKCIFMSGWTADILEHQGVMDPETYILQKPFSRQQLAAILQKARQA